MTASASDLKAHEREIQRQITRTRQAMGHHEFEQALDQFIDTMAFLGWVRDCISVAGGFIPDELVNAIMARYPGFPEIYEENQPDGEACSLWAALSIWAISALQVVYDEDHWAGILACANRDARSSRFRNIIRGTATKRGLGVRSCHSTHGSGPLSSRRYDGARPSWLWISDRLSHLEGARTTARTSSRCAWPP